MSVKSVPNKYEVFQMYYFTQNNKWLSITDAMQYYYDLTEDEKSDFESYYEEETGYQIVDANGYGFSSPKSIENGDGKIVANVVGTKKVSSKTTKDGKIVTEKKDVKIYESGLSSANKTNIGEKARIDAIAQKRGIILDPVWSGYTAEEIMAMYNDGVNIPQDIVDLASSELEANPLNNTDDTDNVEGEDGVDETTEKEPFIKLIPKAKEKIEECEKNNDKLEQEISDLIPDEQKQAKDAKDNFKKQRETLEEYQNSVKEYTKLQKKIENGDALTDKETKRYEDLSKILGAQKDEADGFELNKTEIANSLNDINILAVLGEKLADETIEVGDELGDYTSKTNYKSTISTLIPQVGIWAFNVFASGKEAGEEAVEIGNDTKEYTTQTQNSVDGIADTLDIKDDLASKEAILNGEVQPSEDKVDEAENEEGDKKDNKMPLIINDAFVIDLIKEGKAINSDLARQIKIAIAQTKNAKGDIVFADKADKRITKIVQAFYEEEEKRQAEVEKTEQENEKKQQEIQDVMDEAQKRAEEEAKEENKNVDPNTVDINEVLNKQNDKNNNVQVELTDDEKKKIETLNDEISKNNKKIADIKQESVEHRGEVKKNTSKEKTTVDKAMPVEKQAQKINQAYQEQDLPEHDERMDFIYDAGAMLAQMGTMQTDIGSGMISVGHSLLPFAWTHARGIAMIATGSAILTKGLISIGIGLTAMKVSDDESLIDKAEEKTDIAGVNINRSISDLTTLDQKIVGVTKEMTAEGENDNAETPSATNGAENEENGANGENNGTQAQPSENGSAKVAATTTTTASKTQPTTEAQNETANNEVQQAQADTQNNQTQEADGAETPANNTDVEVKTTSNNSSKSEKDPVKSAAEQKKEATKQKSQLKKQTGKQNSEVKDANNEAKDFSKAAKKLKKDEKKSQKQLEKEAKAIEKEIKKQEEETIKLTKESQEHAKKQEEMIAEYQTLSVQNEMLAAEDAGKQNSPSNNQQQTAGSMVVITTPASQGGNSNKINQNNERITFLSSEFQISSKVIKRNKTKIKTFEASIKTKTKKFQKKTKLVTKKAKATEKKEKQKQKKLKVQLGSVGIAENVFSLTSANGEILSVVGKIMYTTGAGMLTNPFTMAAGVALQASGTVCSNVGDVLITIGTYGTVACGVAKATINIANGNLAAGLMALGQTAISAAMSMTGSSSAGNSALALVSQGLSVTSSTADMVNNVRAVQGKEAKGLASKISTVAGVGSAITGVAGSFTNGKEAGEGGIGIITKQSAFSQGGALTKAATIGQAVGTALSSTSQLMSEFGGESKAANALGMVGGAMNMVSSVGAMAGSKKDKADADNKEAQQAEKQATQEKEEIKAGLDKQIAKEQARMDKERTQMVAEMEANMQANISGQNNQATAPSEYILAPTENSQYTPSSELDLSKPDAYMQLVSNNNETPEYLDMTPYQQAAAASQSDNATFTQTQKTKAEKMALATKISQGVGIATNVAGVFLQNGQNGSQQQNKKAPVAFNDKRTKEIMKKNKKKRENTKKMLESQRKIAALKKQKAAV